MKPFSATVGVLILAAGRSTRMGSNKLLADLCGKPVIAHVADAVAQSGLPAIAVLGHQADRVRGALSGCGLPDVVAADHAEGMARSIAAGVAAIPGAWEGAIICLGDMPLIEAELLRALAERTTADAIVVPMHRGRAGNPVAWGRRYFAELAALQGDRGAKPLISHHSEKVAALAWPDEAIHHDVDTPEAMTDAASALERRSSGTGTCP